MTPKFKATISNGSINFYNREAFTKHIAKLEGDVSITVTKWRKPRSNEQNKYYWGVVVQILSDEIGYTPDEIHDELRSRFLREHGDKIDRIKSTTELSTVEFEDYVTQIKQFASIDLNIYIPDPNDE